MDTLKRCGGILLLGAWILGALAGKGYGIAQGAAAAAAQVAILTTDYHTGSVSCLTVDSTRSVQNDLRPVCSDAVERFHDGLLYVVNRYGCGNIEVLDPAHGWSIVREFSVGAGSNPQDIAFVAPDQAWVSRYETNWLLEVDPRTGAAVDSVSLAALADSADGLCEMCRMILLQNYLLVEVQRLDRSGLIWTPVPPSYLAVVDVNTHTLVDADPVTPGIQGIRLQGTNPDAPIQIEPGTGDLLVPETGQNGVLDAGGIERVDPRQWRSLGFMITESALGGDLVDFSQWTARRAYAVVADLSGNTSLIAFDPSTGQRTAVLYNPGGYVLLDCLTHPSGLLLLADRNQDAPGVRFFDAGTGTAVGSGTLFTGLPPFEMVLMDSTTSVPSTPVSLLGLPYPNPSPGPVQVRWDGPGRPSRLEVFDPAGRLLRSLAWPSSGPPLAGWDGLDAAGRRAPSGVYRLRAVGAEGGASSRPVVVCR